MAQVDILLKILENMKALYPEQKFLQAQYLFYCEKGGLGKKQMESLLEKCRETPNFPSNHIATLEAMLLKKTTKDRSKPTLTAVQAPNYDILQKAVNDILAKFPEHKMILLIAGKLKVNANISQQEENEVYRLQKVLAKK